MKLTVKNDSKNYIIVTNFNSCTRRYIQCSCDFNKIINIVNCRSLSIGLIVSGYYVDFRWSPSRLFRDRLILFNSLGGIQVKSRTRRDEQLSEVEC